METSNCKDFLIIGPKAPSASHGGLEEARKVIEIAVSHPFYVLLVNMSENRYSNQKT